MSQTVSRTRCASCPAPTKKLCQSVSLSSLLSIEAGVATSKVAALHRQEQRLRKALAPYLCLEKLRKLAASGGDLQMAVRANAPLPEEVQALLTVMQILLAPRPDERILANTDIAALLLAMMGPLDHEEFYVICLDTKNHVQRIHPLYKGTLTTAAVRISEVFRMPLQLNSASIIVAHNHPSGVPEASEQDMAITQQVILAGTLLEIEVLDHLIIAQGKWVSLREKRLGWADSPGSGEKESMLS